METRNNLKRPRSPENQAVAPGAPNPPEQGREDSYDVFDLLIGDIDSVHSNNNQATPMYHAYELIRSAEGHPWPNITRTLCPRVFRFGDQVQFKNPDKQTLTGRLVMHRDHPRLADGSLDENIAFVRADGDDNRVYQVEINELF